MTLLKKKARIKLEKSDNGSIILETDGIAHQQLLERGLLYLGWRRCKFYDSANVKKCFNCWGYGHTQKTYKKDRVCNHCAEKHESKECKSKTKNVLTV